MEYCDYMMEMKNEMTNEEIKYLLNIACINDGDGANYDRDFDEAVKIAIEAVNDRRPHGKWIEADNGVIHCSECNEEAYWDTDYGQQKFDFCPNCGSYNKGERRKEEGNYV